MWACGKSVNSQTTPHWALLVNRHKPVLRFRQTGRTSWVLTRFSICGPAPVIQVGKKIVSLRWADLLEEVMSINKSWPWGLDKILTGPLSILKMGWDHITYLGVSAQMERSWALRREEAAVGFLAWEPRSNVPSVCLEDSRMDSFSLSDTKIHKNCTLKFHKYKVNELSLTIYTHGVCGSNH